MLCLLLEFCPRAASTDPGPLDASKGLKVTRPRTRTTSQVSPRTHLTDIAAYTTVAARTVGRVTDVPVRGSGRQITFNSAA